MASLFFSPPTTSLPSSLFTPIFLQNPHHILPFKSRRKNRRPLTISFAIVQSQPDSPNSPPDVIPLLQELAASFELPPDYLAKLPRDLRLDLNDAAFDLANGAVMDECGQEVGEMLLNLSRAWEKGDTSSSASIASQLPSMESSLKGNASFGRRLISAGRRFQSMGQYGQGELQKIAKAMIETGKVLSTSAAIKSNATPKEETRMFKFGDLQVALTPEKANIGAAIAVVFGIISWELSQGVQSIPESSLQYANDNALLLAKSLRGALILIGYSSTVLSACSSVGLLLLARQLKSESES